MARKTHTEAQAKYDKANRRVYGFRLHNEIDSDIIAKLASVPSMQGYIKQLIRQDIAGSVPTPATCSVPKKTMSMDQLYDFLQDYASTHGDGTLYTLLNSFVGRLMGYTPDE